MSTAEMKRQLEETQRKLAEAETKLAAAPKRGAPKISLKVSEKGGLSVYGLGRWPVTLYKGQWRILLSIAGDIENFIVANEAQLSSKD